MVRPPRDLEPYGHLRNVMTTMDGQSNSSIVGDAPPPYWPVHSIQEDASPLARTEDGGDGSRKRWLSPTHWFSSKPTLSADSLGYQLSPLSEGSVSSRSAHLGSQDGTSSSSLVQGRMEVAVVVAMPDRSTKARILSPSTISPPEYQIGVTTASFGRDGVGTFEA
jgi:hypothetical protein